MDDNRGNEWSLVSRLNATLIRKKRSILLFLDNAPCHPPALDERFSNISIKFLPTNTTSKTQPLDAGIIANWKVKYKKRLLRYVCSKVDESNSASDIVKSINISMAMEWRRQAWDEVSPETDRKCFQKTKLYPEEVVEDDDPFEGEDEIDQLQELINKISSCDAGTYISAEEQIETCFGNIAQNQTGGTQLEINYLAVRRTKLMMKWWLSQQRGDCQYSMKGRTSMTLN